MFKSILDNLAYRFKIKILPYLKWYIFGFIFIVSVASFFVPADIFNHDLKVYFLDVGQGDAALIRTPSHQTILIDGGPDNSVIYKLGKYLPFWERKIDLIILTHPHADHLVGLVEVLKRYKVEKIVFTGVSYYSDFYNEFKKLREEKQIPFALALAGRELVFPSPSGGKRKSGEVKIVILSPQQNLWNKVFYGNENDGGGLNDTSVVAQLNFGKNNFLFMGDAGVEAEKELIEQGDISCHSERSEESRGSEATHEQRGSSPDVSSSESSREILRPDKVGTQDDGLQCGAVVLKIGHHGSDTASSYEFLKVVSPVFAIISAGKNKYGLPTYRILYRLRQLGIPILRTDEKGDIKARCNPEVCLIE